MILKILTYPNKILTTKAKSVGEINAEIKKLINDMTETMYAAPGVGLAANQVGISKQIAVLDDGKTGLKVLINPKISQEQGKQTGPEGCLSLPGVEIEIKRPEKLVVDYLDKNGQPQTLKAAGLLARIICHESDHLNGKLIISRAKLWQRLKYKRQLKHR